MCQPNKTPQRIRWTLCTIRGRARVVDLAKLGGCGKIRVDIVTGNGPKKVEIAVLPENETSLTLDKPAQ